MKLSLLTLERYSRKAAARFLATHTRDVPLIFDALLAAEDHRGYHHTGIDWFSIIRATLKSHETGGIRGISTIEQQLVRTVFPRRGVPRWKRKGPELRLAEMLATKMSKSNIWAAYLHCAYYGRDYPGYSHIRAKFIGENEPLTEFVAAQIVSCLKYPAPHWETDAWRHAHTRRTIYVLRRLKNLHPMRSRDFKSPWTSRAAGDSHASRYGFNTRDSALLGKKRRNGPGKV